MTIINCDLRTGTTGDTVGDLRPEFGDRCSSKLNEYQRERLQEVLK